MKIRIATRQSQLALTQAQLVSQQLLLHYPDCDIELVGVTTEGDLYQSSYLHELGGKGLFIKNLEQQLLHDRADIAVHSLKDVPPELDNCFCLAAVLARGCPFDALVSDYASLAELPHQAVIGTSSVRRQAALAHLRPDLAVVMMRGNVDSRLSKWRRGDCTGLILAAAGLERLGKSAYIKEMISPEQMLPSVGQGVIVIECLNDRDDLKQLLSALSHHETFQCILAERAMNRALGASCATAVGSFAVLEQSLLRLLGCVWSRDGSQVLQTEQFGIADEAESIGLRAALHLKQQGVMELLA